MSMEIRKNRLFLSTVADDAVSTAKEFGLGLELAEFCTASNMDTDFEYWDAIVREKMAGTDRFILHAAFNELCPAAIDPLVYEIAQRRYEQSYALARNYGIKQIVAHSGYVPFVYFKEYFTERSVTFWKRFLSDKPADLFLVLENVLEDTPDMLIDIVKGVNDPRFKLCLDVGHANITKNGVTMDEWTAAVVPYLGHVHLHNNRGWPDAHAALGDGDIDIERLLCIILEGQPMVTLTIEARECKKSVDWLISKGFIT